MRRFAFGTARAAALLWLCALMPATGALASEGSPFGITTFSAQTTHTVETFAGEVPVFENVPYTFTQAGGHPSAFTVKLVFASEEVTSRSLAGSTLVGPTRDPKDVVVDLPPGLLGDPMAVPRCSLTRLLGEYQLCPNDTQIGIARLRWFGGGKELLTPIVNVTPEAGQSAEFAVETPQKISFLETAHLVRTGHDYGFAVQSNNIPPTSLVEVEQTFWGVPADASHDRQRGLICTKILSGGPLCANYDRLPANDRSLAPVPSGVSPVPFLTWTTDCAEGAQRVTVRADSWEQPGRVGLNGEYEGYTGGPVETLPGATGCDTLKFEPTLEIRPDTLLADEPVGLSVHLKVPLNELPDASATPQLRDSTVTLPEGMSVSPSVVDGVQACQAEGSEGINIEGPLSEEVGLNGELQLAPGRCPDASTVGTAEAITPFLPVPVKGHVYLAQPGCGGQGQAPCTERDALDGNLYKLYLELGGTGEFANTGIQFKVPGEVQVDPATGQLTTRFKRTVQAPFSELRIDLNGGPRASLANPAVCGPAVTTSDFTPWSAPGTTPEGLLMAGASDATPSSSYEVQGCSSVALFQPGFVAGSVTPQAGQFSAFTLDLTRHDREQYVKGIQVRTPPGLLGMLSRVSLCGEAAAEDGECDPSSQIGTTRVATGAGSHPFEIEGTIYLTGPYEGSPFGLSIVVPVVAGPFNLGKRIVRARIDVDPNDSSLTVTTDETGPRAVPQIVFGVPVRLQRITVKIDRPGFIFNPTDCAALAVEANVSGSEDAVARTSSPFAVAGCKSLAFKPVFKASTNSHTSRTRGASLEARLIYPKNALGNDSNIASVRVELPKVLASRLTTLQKACLAVTFDINPAACPAASVVGVARATTPVLPVEVSGPVYFVSHGGEAFPSLIIVLQGDGVRVDLTGTTFINKAGITSTTFNTIPDVPVETFALYLPQGNYSALAASNGNLCRSTHTVSEVQKISRKVNGRVVRKTIARHRNVPGLIMPTEFAAQNGAIIKQNTSIAVEGCVARQLHSSKQSKHRKVRK